MYTEFTIPPNSHPKVPEGLHKLAGPFDIALIKMRVGVTLMPGRLVPVGQIVKLFFLAYSCTCEVVNFFFLLHVQCAGLPGKHQGPRSVRRSARVLSYINLLSV